ncbi:methyltransferase domain-containing protein [Streptosporangium sp. NBC_01755]|uniref:class I SAM-dependent DNA methyltransferase n=1 Tax=unclassified Streptosporangium TaxID=2632669 RepID=UPI002DD7C99B|nr:MULTISPECIES: class I SAM-dependent methyltransferase [unclassified Streptosporangium]WSA23199.1 methyltransferase domain-containing protein [Streptosporangium sp. NBC_01810]WSC98662.1 methyltransferase domain-containing protein [Streptosporangium sp. NBC_01755]
MRSDVTRAHYDRLADRYDENWAYSPEFIRWMTGDILDRLRLGPGDLAMDLGCGTGLYSRGLAGHASTLVCADPSLAMLERLPADERLIPLHAGAEDLAGGRIAPPHDGYDAILLKEVLHHLADPPEILTGLARLLRPGGRMLVVMLPTSIDYPLFGAALRLFEERQPDPAGIATAMGRSGLATELSYDEFPLAFTVEHYTQMVRNRYMSLLSSFDDAELEAGISEIRREHPGPEVRFPDRFAFVLGVKA